MANAKDKWVEIVWLDAYGEASWKTRMEARDWAHKQIDSLATTKGVLLEKNKKYVLIASTVTDDLVTDLLLVPRSLVKEIKFL